MIQKTKQYQDYINDLYPPPIEKLSTGQKCLTRTATLQVTDACNLACKYCYQINKGTHSMPFETAKLFIDMLLNSTEENNDYINPTISPAIIIEFIGGEPLLEIELIDKISDYFIDQMIEKNHPWLFKYMFSICSNGVLYSDARVQKYLKKHSGNVSFSISIDGNKELHDSCRIFPDGSGSYDIAIAGVHHYVEKLKGKMGSKMTLCPQNIRYTYDAVLNLINEGYTEILLNCVYEEGWTKADATVLYYQLKKVADYIIDNDLYDKVYLSIFEEKIGHPKSHADLENWCGGTGFMISMDYKGDIFPCIRYMESSLGEEIEPVIIGNIFDGIMHTDKQKKCVDCLQCIDRKTQSTDECFDCPIAEGCSWCFKAGTFISTPNGLTPIENLKIGDKVLSGTGQIQEVSNINKRYADADEVISIKASGIPIINTTSEHPFLAKTLEGTGRNRFYSEPKWIPAKDIKTTDIIALHIPSLGDIHIDSEVAYLAGRYVGDGRSVASNRKTPKYYLCCNYNECSELEKHFDAANITYCKDKVMRTAQEYFLHTTNHEIGNNNELLTRIISDAGKYAHGKRVPNEVFSWDKKSVESFLHGYFDADGCYSKSRKTIKYCTASKELAEGISSLLRAFGKKTAWVVRKKQSDIIQGRKVSTHTAYECSFPLYTLKKTMCEIDYENKIMWVTVKGNKNPSVEGYDVFNLTVENEHTFIADGAIVHNCSALNYQLYGTANHRATFICCMHKARVLANVYFHNKAFAKYNENKVFQNNLPKDWALEIIDEKELKILTNLEMRIKKYEC